MAQLADMGFEKSVALDALSSSVCCGKWVCCGLAMVPDCSSVANPSSRAGMWSEPWRSC